MRGVVSHGVRIRTTRIAQGLTQEQLAARADVDVKTIRKAEQGRRLDISTLAGLARALDLDVQTLVVEEQTSPQSNVAVRRAVVERWVAAWDATEIDDLMSLYHEDAIMHLPGDSGLPFGGRHEGKPAIRGGHQLAWELVRTLPQNGGNHSLVVHDETVILYGTKTVCLPDGGHAPLSSVHIFRFSGDLIVEHRVEYDTMAIGRWLASSDR